MDDRFQDYVDAGVVRMRQKADRVAFLRWNPEQATAADVRFLAELVQNHHQHMNDLWAAGAIRPRHEWHIWHQDVKEQLWLNREAFHGGL